MLKKLDSFSPAEAGARSPLWLGLSADRLVLLLVAAVLALRLVSLAFNATDLYYDEAQYWAWAQDLDFGYYSKPPLLAWLIAATTIFGDSTFLVRIGAPILHCATALLIYALAKRLFTPRIGLIAAVIWLTIPGVALSSHIISTDVPLLFFWSLALLAFVRFLEGKRWTDAVLLGAAIGLGINSKYAMAFLPPALVLFCASTADARWVLRDRRFWGAIGIGLLLVVPNLVWNAEHHFATFAHTRDNADWNGLTLHPLKMLEFLGAQFGVFGPVLFGAFLVLLIRRRGTGNPEATRLLLWTSLPIFAAILVQALLSRALGNWAGTAFPAVTVYVAAALSEGRAETRALRWGLGVNVAVAIAVLVAPAFAARLVLPSGRLAFERVLGWSEFGEALADVAKQEGARTLIFARRSDIASMIYALRDDPLVLVVLPPEGAPSDHFQMTRAFTGNEPRPALLVAPVDYDDPEEAIHARPDGPETLLPVEPGVSKSGLMRVQPVAW